MSAPTRPPVSDWAVRSRQLLQWRERRRARQLEAMVRRLADWPRPLPADTPALVRESALAARQLFRVPRALVVWEDPDEPFLNLAHAEGDLVEESQEAPETFEPAIAPELAGQCFFAPDPQRSRRIVSRGGEPREAGAPPLHPGMAERFRMSGVLVVPVHGAAIEGHLILIGLAQPHYYTDGALALAVSSLIGARADQVLQMAEQRTAALQEERARVARDLHDTILQSFTGVVLQIETAHDLLTRDPEEARRVLTGVEGRLMEEQRQLRAYVDDLRPRSRRASTHFDLAGHLEDLRQRYIREWKISMDYEIGAMHPLVTQALGMETFRMVAEAVANSAKHGQATAIRVELFTREDRLRIVVVDDGIGFPFRGRYNLPTLLERQIGPGVLGERVAALNGEMVVQSTEEGSRVEIALPLGWQTEG